MKTAQDTSTDRRVRIVEVGPRDGLQNISSSVPTATKVELISQLRETGLQAIELTSIVSPKAIPQLSDSQVLLQNDVVRELLDDSLLELPVLIPNRKGLDIALRHGVREIAVFVSATEGFSQANIRCSVDEGLQRAKEVTEICASKGIRVRGYISCIFSDPYDGPTPMERVLYGVQKLLDMGCYEVSLGDTLGVGTAPDVRNLLAFLLAHGIPVDRLAGHFHDTYGQAVGNVWTAYESGIRSFDSSVAGLGGCPFAPGAKGNVATEDIVYMFHRAGVETGVDLSKLAGVGDWISKKLGKANDSRAGAALVAKQQQQQQQHSAEARVELVEGGKAERSMAMLSSRVLFGLNKLWPSGHIGGLRLFRPGPRLGFILSLTAPGRRHA